MFLYWLNLGYTFSSMSWSATRVLSLKLHDRQIISNMRNTCNMQLMRNTCLGPYHGVRLQAPFSAASRKGIIGLSENPRDAHCCQQYKHQTHMALIIRCLSSTPALGTAVNFSHFTLPEPFRLTTWKMTRSWWTTRGKSKLCEFSMMYANIYINHCNTL